MRRIFLSTFAIGFLVGMLTGCQNFFCHTAGICDCDFDDDPCTHRAPWVRNAAPPTNNGAPQAVPQNETPPLQPMPAQPVSRRLR